MRTVFLTRWLRPWLVETALGTSLGVASVVGLASPLLRAEETVQVPHQAPSDPLYAAAVRRTAGMVGDAAAQRLARDHHLGVLNLTWEDTGRFKNSAVGPNISDMTIQVPVTDRNGVTRLNCMPVIRHDNFSDRSADVAPEKFFLQVGNEKGRDLRRVSLREYLGNPRLYLRNPKSWTGDGTYLLADRDTHVLVSAQACFLPVPKDGVAEFNPVLFNYQSAPGDPAVLAILATREGTSATIIDNQRDTFRGEGGAWGQQLYFNQNGQRARFTGQRLSDFPGGSGGPSVQLTKQKGLNMVLLIQVPLKQKERPRHNCWPTYESDGMLPLSAKEMRRSNVEDAVIGHGKAQGPFTEIAGLPIERDSRFPVRVTVQFYKATSDGVVSERDMKEIAEQINKVYDQGDFVGSLVTEGHTQRPTEHDGPKVQPPSWWADFWRHYQQHYGKTRPDVLRELRETHGADWVPATERALADEAGKLASGGAREGAPETAAPAWQPTQDNALALTLVGGCGLLGMVGGLGLRRRGR
jgi:hypothetical protein